MSNVTQLKAFKTLPKQLQYFFKRFPPNLSSPVKYPPGFNPFKSSFNITTKKWNEPIYSLRRQKELLELAAEYNMEDLLPKMRKQEVGAKVMKGTIKWKGRRAVRMRKQRQETIKKALIGHRSAIKSKNSLKSFMKGLKWKKDPF